MQVKEAGILGYRGTHTQTTFVPAKEFAIDQCRGQGQPMKHGRPRPGFQCVFGVG